MDSKFLILAINPGSTSTKIALYRNEECSFEEVIRHSAAELAPFAAIYDQYPFRLKLVQETLAKHCVNPADLSAVVGRGGPINPVESGTYIVNDLMAEHLRLAINVKHASHLGGLLARGIADPQGIPAYIVDPVAVDEYIPMARLTGLPEMQWRSVFHALNLKAIARRAAQDHHLECGKATFVMAHLGGGISVGVQKDGRMIDVANPNETGPFSPERAGALPSGELVRLCYSGKYTMDEVMKKIVGNGGIVAYLGTNNGREIEQRIAAGDATAALVYETMAYQVSKYIGAMAAAVSGKVDAVILTGGLAYSARLVPWITQRVEFIAPVWVYPGEDELKALAEGALRVLRGEEQPKTYQ